MARLRKGEKPTPRPVRIKRNREDLVARGGMRLIVDIEKPTSDALREIMDSEDPPLTKKDAVSAALINFAGVKAESDAIMTAIKGLAAKKTKSKSKP